eukprot:GAHX01001504.1.p1 GENE.GAHX01001504.1~~GAHX01001504.1.p1  ORF type:complete len:375 (-),score=59.98 GAHX01001504.1:40-1164(-)
MENCTHSNDTLSRKSRKRVCKNRRLFRLIIFLSILILLTLGALLFVTIKFAKSNNLTEQQQKTLTSTTHEEVLYISTDRDFNDTTILETFILQYNTEHKSYNTLTSYSDETEQTITISGALYTLYKDYSATFDIQDTEGNSTIKYKSAYLYDPSILNLEFILSFVTDNYPTNSKISLFDDWDDNSSQDITTLTLKRDTFYWLEINCRLVWYFVQSINTNWKFVKQKVLFNRLIFMINFFWNAFILATNINAEEDAIKLLLKIKETNTIEWELNLMRRYKNAVKGLTLFVVYSCINDEGLQNKFENFKGGKEKLKRFYELKESFKKEKLIIALIYQLDIISGKLKENEEKSMELVATHFERIGEELEGFVDLYNQ